MGKDVVIRAEGLGKKYIIGHQAGRESYVALRDVIARNTRNLWRTATDLIKGRPSIEGDELEEFWALRDVSFEVERGDVVGVIGRNGAGKSTLLKVLSRITEPTEGRVEIRGRVSSLLEVGTGFHPELTGRENIYLNGAILGMTHGEIRRKFDEIVAFAEVEQFLDTPVKRYSSGMYVRLAFAVAAHLEPEILIVDEVLAVGDAEFQKKCLGKMGEVAGEGRTVLFVSHNMASIASLCNTGLLLSKGRVASQASVNQVISKYSDLMREGRTNTHPGVSFFQTRLDSSRGARVFASEILDDTLSPISVIKSMEYAHFRVHIHSSESDQDLSVYVDIKTISGLVVAKFESDPKLTPLVFASNEFSIDCIVKSLPLMPGEYRLCVGVGRKGMPATDHVEDAANFTVAYASDPRLAMNPWTEGLIATEHSWSTRATDARWRPDGTASLIEGGSWDERQ